MSFGHLTAGNDQRLRSDGRHVTPHVTRHVTASHAASRPHSVTVTRLSALLAGAAVQGVGRLVRRLLQRWRAERR